jgi:glutamine synthetase type III
MQKLKAPRLTKCENNTACFGCNGYRQSKKTVRKQMVYTHSELEARHEIELEKYIKKVQIEARVMGDLAINHILPSAIKYQNKQSLENRPLFL